MALSRFVVTASVTLTPDVVATVVAGEPGTGGPAGFGNAATGGGVGSAGKFGLFPMNYPAGTVIMADSTAGNTGPQLLYQAFGANIRPYVQGQDDVGHAALSN